ncbi:MAG: guanylate kinase, partial [Anaerolineae bacterium]|nr:guanylate kinase [Anaerolineae bacterium]
YKGIPKAGVRAALASGQDVVMRVDVQGAATVRAIVPQAVTIFLTAESEEALIERLRRRRTEDEAQLQRRIETARAELARATEFKYRVVNRECALDDTVDHVIAIMTAEKARIDWQPVTL